MMHYVLSCNFTKSLKGRETLKRHLRIIPWVKITDLSAVDSVRFGLHVILGLTFVVCILWRNHNTAFVCASAPVLQQQLLHINIYRSSVLPPLNSTGEQSHKPNFSRSMCCLLRVEPQGSRAAIRLCYTHVSSFIYQQLF